MGGFNGGIFFYFCFQDFESWDDVGLNIAQPPDLLHLYRDYSSHVMPAGDQCEGGCQTELEVHDIAMLESQLETVKNEMVNILRALNIYIYIYIFFFFFDLPMLKKLCYGHCLSICLGLFN